MLAAPHRSSIRLAALLLAGSLPPAPSRRTRPARVHAILARRRASSPPARNAITDVAGVRVGQDPVEGDTVRTGVTANPAASRQPLPFAGACRRACRQRLRYIGSTQERTGELERPSC